MPRSTLQSRDRELLKARNYCHVAVPTDDNTIQTVVVWCDLDDNDQLVVNGAEGREWPANLRRAGRATLTVMNLDNPEEYVSIVARLVEDTHDGAEDVINALGRKYDGRDFDLDPRQQRIIFRLAPERVRRNRS
jgi:Pyridoxamine 5'-phosphate oxidase